MPNVDGDRVDFALIARAVELLRAGELVAFPTETVYGLGALAMDAAHVARIFEAKGRPATNPLIVHVRDLEDARRVGVMTPLAEKLASALWPGPITLVVPRCPEVPDIVTAGGDTVAIRAPSHPVARALLTAVGAPIAAPSANRSTEISPTRAEHVVSSLGERVAAVLDGGSCEIGIESTVVDVSERDVVILRPGSIDAETIARVAGVAVRTREGAADFARSPGLSARHYAPRVPMRIVEGAALDEITVLNGTGVLALAPRVGDVTLPRDAEAYAAGLYAALRTLEASSARIFVEAPPTDAAWTAIWDRLHRAAHEGA
jgi:L-threonylcarbamoyladenylate synthase